jgi:glutamate decarboxylase
MPVHSHQQADSSDVVSTRPQFAREPLSVPRHHMPAGEMSPGTAFQIVSDELMLDGNARLNLATFVTTWMEPEAAQLMSQSFDKNMIDKDEYPQTAALEMRCVNMLARLWGAEPGSGVGCSTTGSSEAAMLGGLALKWRWRARRQAAGRPADRPNLVMGANVQVCWDKFCRYWDVEARLVPVEEGATHLTAEGAVAVCDENTIGVVAVLGSTYDGTYEPVADIAAALDRLQAERGLDIPVHVDGASGGFVAPFIDTGLVWDFRLPRVASINASGHKYGLVYPGVGWIIWRDSAALPDDLVFKVDYLGGNMPTFALNFSRPGSQVIAQYYNFIRLGRDGYTRVQQACRDTAMWLSEQIAATSPFELISNGSDLPVFAFRIREGAAPYTVFDVSEWLRTRGWLVPAYRFPANLQDVAMLRVVVRNGFGRDLAGLLVEDLTRVVNRLGQAAPGGLPPSQPSAFHH